MARSISKVTVTTTSTKVASQVSGISIFNLGSGTVYMGFDEATGTDGMPIPTNTERSYFSTDNFDVWLDTASGSHDCRLLIEP